MVNFREPGKAELGTSENLPQVPCKLKKPLGNLHGAKSTAIQAAGTLVVVGGARHLSKQSVNISNMAASEAGIGNSHPSCLQVTPAATRAAWGSHRALQQGQPHHVLQVEAAAPLRDRREGTHRSCNPIPACRERHVPHPHSLTKPSASSACLQMDPVEAAVPPGDTASPQR